MPNESPMNDPRNIWQNQPKEPFKMSADEMRLRAQRFQMKARLTAASAITSALLVCAFFAWNFARTHELVPRMGYGLISLCGNLYGIFDVQMGMAQQSPCGRPGEHFSRVLSKRVGEAPRLPPAYLAQNWSDVLLLGRGDGCRAGADRGVWRPASLLEHDPFFPASHHMVCTFLPWKKAESAQASTGDRRVARI